MNEYFYDDHELYEDPFLPGEPDDGYMFYPSFLQNPTGEFDRTIDENENLSENEESTNNQTSYNGFQTQGHFSQGFDLENNKKPRKPLQEIQNEHHFNTKSTSPYFLTDSAGFYEFDKVTSPSNQQRPSEMTQSNVIQKNNEICPLANLKDQLKNLIPVTQLRNNHFKSILTKMFRVNLL